MVAIKDANRYVIDMTGVDLYQEILNIDQLYQQCNYNYCNRIQITKSIRKMYCDVIDNKYRMLDDFYITPYLYKNCCYLTFGSKYDYDIGDKQVITFLPNEDISNVV